ncbi:MAG: hypothetical protein K6V36_06015 [Anaerolineae bacterium]|nr:hypothetical protein [Anaerolineae bacterium]
MSRRSLTVPPIVAPGLVCVSLVLMAAAMAGAFGPFAHGLFFFRFSPLAWALMITAMVLGGLGVVAFILVLLLVLIRAMGPRSRCDPLLVLWGHPTPL